MRKLFFFFALIFSVSGYSQAIDKAVNDAIDKKLQLLPINTAVIDSIVTAKISQFSKTLDSSVLIVKTVTGTFNIDTIRQTSSNAWYMLTIGGESGTNRPVSVKMVNIAYSGGVYSIPNITTVKAFTGLTGGAFDIVLINGVPCVKITSTSNVKWTYKRTSL
jgi:hypothetical protein